MAKGQVKVQGKKEMGMVETRHKHENNNVNELNKRKLSKFVNEN